MNATNLDSGFAVTDVSKDMKKPGTSGGVKSTVNTDSLAKQKTSKWAGGASSGAGKPPTSSLAMAGNSIMRSSIDASKTGNQSLNGSSSQNIMRIAEEGEGEGEDKGNVADVESAQKWP
jgi:hypothetical protein